MPERDRLAENLFKEGSLRDEVGMMIMDDLVRLLKRKNHRRIAKGSTALSTNAMVAIDHRAGMGLTALHRISSALLTLRTDATQ